MTAGALGDIECYSSKLQDKNMKFICFFSNITMLVSSFVELAGIENKTCLLILVHLPVTKLQPEN